MEPDPTDAPRVVRRRADLIVLCVAVIVVFLSTVALGSIQRVPDQERAVFEAINGLPAWIAWLVVPVMQLGVFWAGPLVAFALFVWGRRTAGAAVLVATVGAYLIARIAKQFVGRERPDALIDKLNLRDAAEGLGFPSGHSAVAAALVLAIVPYLAWRWRYALLALPLIVAFARVYVGAHLPLDVVAGLAIGAGAASLTHLAFGVPVTSERRPRSAPSSPRIRQSTEQRAGPG
jgi:glycosyltransferase 2 family protein